LYKDFTNPISCFRLVDIYKSRSLSMKKALLFLSLISIVFVALPEISLAKKKYRYIKREHGVKFGFNLPMTLIPFSGVLDLQGAYTYNWKGRLEFGLYGGLGAGFPGFAVSNYSGGILGEYNIVKNRGKVKFIPAIGLTFGVLGVSGLKLATGLHTSLKFFVAKRTPFTLMIGYQAAVPTSFNFQEVSHHINVMGGFSYYFDFY